MRDRIFDLEAKRLAARKAGDVNAYHAISAEMNRNALAVGLVQTGARVIEHAVNARISERVMRLLAGEGLDSSELVAAAGEDDLRLPKKVVEELTGTDLSDVELIRGVSIDGEEGSALACGQRGHAIIIPRRGFQSLDLVVHELGHTAEFMARRAVDDVRLLVSHVSIAEAVAYYCQFQFLIRYGTPAQRQGALGAFQRGYFATQFLYALNKTKSPDVTRIIAHARFNTFLKVYLREDIIRHLGPFLSKPPAEICQNYIDRLFAIPMALRLISRGDSVRPLLLASIDVPVKQAITDSGLNGRALMDFRDLGDLFLSFIDGSIGTHCMTTKRERADG